MQSPKEMDAQINAAADKAIVLMEAYLNDNFGIKVPMGAEQEYCAYSPEKDGVIRQTNPLGLMGEEYAKNMLYTKNIPRDLIVRDLANPRKRFMPARHFEHHPHVTSHYKEGGPCQYEVVIGHKTFAKPSGVALADTVEEVRKQIIYMCKEQKLHHSFSPHLSVKVSEADRGYLPQKETHNIRSAFQLDFSLTNRHGKNLFSDMEPSQATTASTCLGNRMLEMQKETLLFHEPTLSGFDRLRIGGGRIPHEYSMDWPVKGSLMCRSTPPFFEDRLAGSNANPRLVILSALAGIVYAVENQERIKIDNRGALTLTGDHAEEAKNLGPVSLDRAEAVDALAQKSGLFRNTVNRISGNELLGDQICDMYLTMLKARSRTSESGGLNAVR